MTRKMRIGAKILMAVLFILVVYLIAVVVQHERYNRETFNCVHMSREMKEVFECLGLNTEMVQGRHRETGGLHQWLALNTSFGLWHFEPINLMFFDSYDSYDVLYIGKW